MKKIAVVHGRFQPLHNGHLYDYILEARNKSKCDFMYIGLTNSDNFHVKESKSNPLRSLPQNNPLTFLERLEMIKAVMAEQGWELDQFDIIPFPINVPELLPQFSPQNATYYLTIFDEWGEEKATTLKNVYGEKAVEILYRRTIENKRMSSFTVRQKIQNDETWEDLVPNAVAEYLKLHKLDDRIKEIQNNL
jgi:nicotinamide mononucleotide adenylyltransferase